MTARPKILMLTTQLGYGGAETSFIRLANALAETMDVTVALFTRDYGDGAYGKGHEPLNANIVLLDASSSSGRLRRWLRRVVKVRALKAQHMATISFLSGPNLVNVLAGYRARSIVSLRGSRRYDPLAPTLQKWLFRYIGDPIVFALAARIVPVSGGLRHEISTWASILSKVVAIPPFIEVNRLPERLAQQAPAPYAALAGQNVVVAVGRLSVEKGFHHLIRVFYAVQKRIDGAKLLLVGDGPMADALRAQCAALNLPVNRFDVQTSSVIFTGYQPQVLALMALGRVYVLSSATEGFPSVLLEAMAAEVPVVAADTPWGARAILIGDEAQAHSAYPTRQPTLTPYGTLMPRIDDLAYESIWVDVVCDQLNRTPIANEKARARIDDFDIDRVVAQWRNLLASMEGV